ncbi:MAG: hypothetical protein R3C53_11185 [Pirellulaceae bacterium]
MLISFRRFQWGLIALLALTAACLVRPVRSWLDQITARQLHPNLTVGEAYLHGKHSVVEIRKFNWTSEDAGIEVALSADTAWFAVDAEPLLDRRVVLPRALIQDATLTMDAERPQVTVSVSVWQQQLAQRVATLDWNQIKDHFSSLLAAEDLTQSWSERISRWVARSQEIADEAETLRKEVQDLDNPLRFEEVVRQKIARLQQLSNEQAVLCDQFGGIEKLLQSETEQLHEKLNAEQRAIEDRFEAECENPALTNEIALDLLLSEARSVWQGLRCYAEVGDRLVRSAAPPRTIQNEFNVRANHRPLVDLQDIDVEGLFMYDNRHVPFQLTTHYHESLNSFYASQQGGLWQLAFQPDLAKVAVTVCNRISQPNVNDLQLSVATSQTSASFSGEQSVEEYPVQVVLATDGNTLCGQLDLLPSDLLRAFEVASQNSLQLSVGGTWNQPEFGTEQPLPPWLMALARRKIEAALTEARMVAASELKTQFAERLAKLDRVATSTVQAGLQSATAHREQTLGTLAQFQRQLEETAGVEFARRPGAAIR